MLVIDNMSQGSLGKNICKAVLTTEYSASIPSKLQLHTVFSSPYSLTTGSELPHRNFISIRDQQQYIGGSTPYPSDLHRRIKIP